MKTLEELQAIVGRFDVKGGIQEIKPLGNGLINDTLLVKTDGPDNYVLQRVNNAIFKDVDLLQHNIDCATAHIRRKLAGDPDIDRKVLTFIPCKETGKTYWTDGETYWRVSGRPSRTSTTWSSAPGSWPRPWPPIRWAAWRSPRCRPSWRT